MRTPRRVPAASSSSRATLCTASRTSAAQSDLRACCRWRFYQRESDRNQQDVRYPLPCPALSAARLTATLLRKGTSVTWHQRELTLEDILSDPITKEVMKADSVDPHQLSGGPLFTHALGHVGKHI